MALSKRALILVALSAGVVGLPAVALARGRRAAAGGGADAAGGAGAAEGVDGTGGAGADETPAPFQPPPPPTPPPPLPPPPKPSPAVGLLTDGSKVLSAVLLATPLAPLAVFVGPLGALLGGLAADNEKAKYAQDRLQAAARLALDQAEYEGYMAEWAAGQSYWDAGLVQQAQQHFDNADAAGKAHRLEIAQKLDELEVGSFRAWMGKPHFPKSDGDQLWAGWLLGDGGFTGQPMDSITDGPRWFYRRRADGRTFRFHWSPSHPDYNGTEIPPLTPEQVRLADEERQREDDAAAVQFVTGEDEISDLKHQGGAVRARVTTGSTPPPPASPPTPPPAPPTPPAAPAPTPPAAPVPTPPVPRIPAGTRKKLEAFEDLGDPGDPGDL
ncbi:MAG: hypothetical protein ACXU86_11830 [Archangium sp.]